MDPTDLLSSPLQVTWVVTSRCNLSCAYCLEGALEPDAPDEPRELRELVAREIVDNRVLLVTVSGGEPLLAKELASYVHTLASAGTAVRVTSNGVLMDETWAASLIDAGVRIVEISAHPQTGAKPVEAARMLVQRGARVVGRLVVTESNCAEAGGLAKSFVDAGVERVVLQEIVPLGRALNAKTEFPEPASLEALRDDIARLRQEHGKGRVHLASVTLQEESVGGPVECSIDMTLRKSCEIRPDGNVLPCSPAAALGARNMIAEKGLRQCWLDLPAIFGTYASDEPAGPCVSCAKAPDCTGGCRALFKTANADPDILCRFRVASPDRPAST